MPPRMTQGSTSGTASAMRKKKTTATGSSWVRCLSMALMDTMQPAAMVIHSMARTLSTRWARGVAANDSSGSVMAGPPG